MEIIYAYIIHAVTMRYPGLRTSKEVVRILLPKIIKEACGLNLAYLAILLLGTGTGGLKESEVMEIYENYFKNINDIDIY